MLYQVTADQLETVTRLLSKEADANLFFLADIEQYGIDNEIVKIWIDDRKTPHTALLKYRKNAVIYSDTDAFDVPELLAVISEQSIRFISGLDRVVQKIVPFLRLTHPVRPCFMARLSSLAAFHPMTGVRRGQPGDGVGIARSITTVEEFESYRGVDPVEEGARFDAQMEKELQIFYLIEEDGRVVANANTSAMSRVSAMIGGVFCLPAYRNRGYATAVVGALCADLLKRNITPILFFDNPKAASIYHRLGFQDFAEYTIVNLNDVQ